MSRSVENMLFSGVLDYLVQKVERKGGKAENVFALTTWLTGYSEERLHTFMQTPLTYGEFFKNAPELNPLRHYITGSICGVKIAEISDPLMKEVRYLDKLVDDLAKGKSLENIINKLNKAKSKTQS